ncbi:YbaK/EbsC family protein [Peptococcus simiae]|uniref:YbaK/EbsC family protein n=1 Tax=Peptococcus simiae TaxID=1643805 RepID=A0ABW9H0M3_9FIRM
MFVSDPVTSPPTGPLTPVQERIYALLEELEMPYQRVACEAAIRMEDCAAIEDRLATKIVKSLLLTNRQETAYYLYVLPGEAPYKASAFSQALGVARAQFAKASALQSLLGTDVGGTTILSAVWPAAREVQLVIDQACLAAPTLGCTDGTPTGYLKIASQDLLNLYLPACGRQVTLI